MNPSLWLLIGLQIWGWLRYFFRNLRTIKGALLAFIGVGILGFWVFGILLMPQDRATGVAPEVLRMQGPAYLLAYILLNILLSSSERGLYFAPSEVDFLFSGPFTRREILSFKILNTVLAGIPTTLMLALVFRIHSPWFVSAYVGLFLLFTFMSLLTLALHLLAITLGKAVYGRLRYLIVGLSVVGLIAVGYATGFWRTFEPARLLEQLQASDIWYYLSWPMHAFIETFLASNLLDLTKWSAAAIAVNCLLLALVFQLDTNYLETAAAASARTFAQIKRIRAGNLYTSDRRGTKVRFHLPAPPYLGGIGPTVYRQMTTAVRSLGRLSFVLIIMGISFLSPFFATARSPDPMGFVIISLSMTIWMTILLSSMVPFDFRGDVDRMAELKALPVSSLSLSLGQLLTPTLMLSCIQWFVISCLLVLLLLGKGPVGLSENNLLLVGIAAMVFFVPPFNLLIIGLENLLFLLFPSRMQGNQPGDFQAVGRNTVMVMAKLFSFSLVMSAAGGVTVFVYFFLGKNLPLALFSGWIVLTLAAAALIPAVALAYDLYDVSRDAPP